MSFMYCFEHLLTRYGPDMALLAHVGERAAVRVQLRTKFFLLEKISEKVFRIFFRSATWQSVCELGSNSEATGFEFGSVRRRVW